MSAATPVAVLASGGGSNFQALLDRFTTATGPARVAGLIASRETAGAIARAERAGVPFAVLPPDRRDGGEREATFLLETLREWDAGLVVLAGYLRLVPETVVRALWGRLINVHPALLPSFGGAGIYGARVHRAVVERGVRVTGVTVHFVDVAYDRGPIIAQWPVPVGDEDGPDEVAARVLAVEHSLLPAVVEAIVTGRVALSEEGRVTYRGAWRSEGRYLLDGAGPDELPPEPTAESS